MKQRHWLMLGGGLVAVALTVCAYVLYAQENDQERLAVLEIEKLGGECRRDPNLPGRPVVEVSFKKPDPDDEKPKVFREGDMYHLCDLPHLRVLDLRNAEIERMITRQLSRETLEKLEGNSLRLIVGRSGVDHRLNMPSLQTLILPNRALSTGSLLLLDRFHKLHVLDRAQADDGGRPGSDDKIVTLDLRNASEYLHPKALLIVRTLPALKSLELSDVAITDPTLAALARIDKLYVLTRATNAENGRPSSDAEVTSLDLSFTPITDWSLGSLKGLKNLKSLNLSKTDAVTESAMKALGGFGHLETLDLAADKAPPLTFLDFKKLPRLTTLKVGPGQLTDAALDALAKADKLQVLSQATNAKGGRPTKASEIAALDLTGTEVTNKGLVFLKGLTGLGTLNLTETNVTEDGAKQFEKAFKTKLEVILLRPKEPAPKEPAPKEPAKKEPTPKGPAAKDKRSEETKK